MGRATSITIKAFGILASIAGIEHGIGAVLQGDRAPEGRTFESWPDSEAFRILAGEPAMTLVPSYLITGILAILASLSFLVWVTVFVESKHGGLGLLVISVTMLFVGAGFGPPLLGLILGITATRINAPLSWWRSRVPDWFRERLGVVWPWSLGAAIIAWIMLFPGLVLLSHFAGIDGQSATASAVASAVMFSAFGFLGLTILSALSRDATAVAKSPVADASIHRPKYP